MNSNLRLADLGKERHEAAKLMNLKIPTELSDAIDRLAKELGASKTATFIALVNEGLDAALESLKDWKPKKVKLPPPKKVCSVAGCGKAFVARGYCVNHYQASRRSNPAKPKRSSK